MSEEELLRKQYYDKEAAQVFERTKLETELAKEVSSLSNINLEKVNEVLEKYQKKSKSLMNEDPPAFPKLEEEVHGE